MNNNKENSFWKHVFNDIDEKIVASWPEAIEKNINAHPQLLSQYNHDGLTPLQWAAFDSKIPTTLIEVFLNNNVDINQVVSEPSSYANLTLLEAIKQIKEDLINSHETILLSTIQRLDKIELMLVHYKEKQELESKIKENKNSHISQKI
jgi:ankyrin repeat protein